MDGKTVIFKEVVVCESKAASAGKGGRIALRMVGEAAQALHQQTQNALSAMLPNDGDTFLLTEREINADNTFVDYDGNDHIFGGFVRQGKNVTLLGYNEEERNTYPVNLGMFAFSELINVIRCWRLYDAKVEE